MQPTPETAATFSYLDTKLKEAWKALYQATNPGCRFAIFRWTVRDTLIFQGAYLEAIDAQFELQTMEARHPARNYFIWDVPEELQ